MALEQLVPGVYAISFGFVNAFLIDADELVVVDTGVAGSAGKILDALRELGKAPSDVRHILVTHCHADHSGSLQALKAATGAPAYMHSADAALVREGRATRPMRPSPGLLPTLMYLLAIRFGPKRIRRTEPAAVEYEVEDGQRLPIAGSIEAIHVPGHSAGQLAFLWPRHGGVLFAADAAGNMRGKLGLSPFYEDLADGRRSLQRLAARDFDVACFGHGTAILGGAAERFRETWPALAEPHARGA